ncbi:hypothetical protein B9Q09_05660 [Candidatus Marsarchaeota G2 archaeon ECH_B_SAG-C16]|uniref:Cdc6 C-terminal domain-containing protein n=1 Tax=Candidatus Marsarchaeota G2 archaeon ECH_B_SAG-C16 TaxID=1978163 RepID=A0A2R6B4P3_9ARCH|nr:MAG: hypothetical protein B9Q09_05660 [Candidatus Marsarchaeota G2 archaeon ECH_B_SAG-C16]
MLLKKGLIYRSIFNLHRISRDYLPPTLPFRDLEIRWLGDELGAFIKSPDKNTGIMVVGDPGVGKSSAVEMTVRVLASSPTLNGDRSTCFVHITDTVPRTVHGFLSEILNYLAPFKTTVGVSDNELASVLGESLVEGNLRLIVLLDQLRLTQGTTSLLNRLIELNDGVRSKPICLVVSTRAATAGLQGFDVTRTLEVKPYSKTQVDEILTYRLRLAGIEDVVDDQAKEHIVSQAGLRGDMGYAMELLAGSFTLSSQLKDTRIRLEHVTQVEASYLDVSMAMAVRRLDIHEKLLLYSICTLLSAKEQTRLSMGEAESAYSDLCLRLNLKPRMHTQLWCYVQKLYDLGIIDTFVGGRGQRGRTTNISVPHSLNPLISELRRQIKNMPRRYEHRV